MSSSDLYIALKNAINDLGIDILKSPTLVSVLSDYHAFDMHDPMLKEKKVVIKTLVTENYYDKILEWRKNTDTHWENEDGDWLNDFCKRTGLKRTVVGPIADTMKMAVGLKEQSRDFSDIEGMFLLIKKEYLDALERLIQVHTDRLKLKTAYYSPEATTELYLLEGKMLILAKDKNEIQKWYERNRKSAIEKHSTPQNVRRRKSFLCFIVIGIIAIIVGLTFYIVANRINYAKNKPAITAFEEAISKGDESMKSNDPFMALFFYTEAGSNYDSDYHAKEYKQIASEKQNTAILIIIDDYSTKIGNALDRGDLRIAKDLRDELDSMKLSNYNTSIEKINMFDEMIYKQVIIQRNNLLKSISMHKGVATKEEMAIIEDLLYCYPDDYYLRMIKDKIK